MHIVYIDDSTQSKPPRRHMGELIAIGGVIVPQLAVAGYESALTQIRAELRIPDHEEIKWKPPKGSHLASAGGEVNLQLRARMLQAAIDHQIKSAVVVWDRGRVDWTPDKIGPEILKYLYERITMHLTSAEDGVGIIIADEPGGGSKAEKQWLAATLGLTSQGTRYATPDRIVSPILTAPSHHVPHLQLADLVTAATTAAIAGHPHGIALVPLLKQIARTNNRGWIGGAGVVLWPPDLRDLYYWVLGEAEYAKDNRVEPLGPSALRGDVFAMPGRPYLTDDGLPARS